MPNIRSLLEPMQPKKWYSEHCRVIWIHFLSNLEQVFLLWFMFHVHPAPAFHHHFKLPVNIIKIKGVLFLCKLNCPMSPWICCYLVYCLLFSYSHLAGRKKRKRDMSERVRGNRYWYNIIDNWSQAATN